MDWLLYYLLSDCETSNHNHFFYEAAISYSLAQRITKIYRQLFGRCKNLKFHRKYIRISILKIIKNHNRMYTINSSHVQSIINQAFYYENCWTNLSNKMCRFFSPHHNNHTKECPFNFPFLLNVSNFMYDTEEIEI